MEDFLRGGSNGRRVRHSHDVLLGKARVLMEHLVCQRACHLLDKLDVLLRPPILASNVTQAYALTCSPSFQSSVSIRFIGFRCSEASSLGAARLRSPNDEYCDNDILCLRDSGARKKKCL